MTQRYGQDNELRHRNHNEARQRKVLNEYESEDESLKMSVKAYVDEVSNGAVTSSSVCELYKVSNNEAGKEYTGVVKQEEAVSRDSDGKVKEVEYAIEGDTALFGNSYEYDDLGRLTKKRCSQTST